MADENELFNRTDALFRRHARQPGEGESIPLLTDIVEGQAAAAAEPAPASVDDDTGTISREVFLQVMEEIESRLAVELGRRLTDHLVSEVQVAVTAALSDTRQDLANAIGDAVAEAMRRRAVK